MQMGRNEQQLVQRPKMPVSLGTERGPKEMFINTCRYETFLYSSGAVRVREDAFVFSTELWFIS